MIIKNINEFGVSQSVLKENKKGVDFLLPIFKRFLNYLGVYWQDQCCNTVGTTPAPLIAVPNLQAVTDVGNTITNSIILSGDETAFLVVNNNSDSRAGVLIEGGIPSFQLTNTSGGDAKIKALNLTADRIYQLPDASGTFALEGNYIPLAGTAGIPATGDIEINANVILNGAILKYDAALLSYHFGIAAGAGSVGNNLNAFGNAAGYNNAGNNVNANGNAAGSDNVGNNLNAAGYFAGYTNSGSNVNANGYFAGYANTGSNVNANGNGAGVGNTFSNVDLSGINAQADANKQQVFNNGVANTRWDYNLITADILITIPNTGGFMTVQGGDARLKLYTVASLPSGIVGDICYVSDALSPTYLGTLVGGGAVVCPAFFNGTAWVAH